MTTTLFVCELCGSPVALRDTDAAQIPEWERIIGAPLVVHCLSCAEPLIRRDH